MREAIFSLTITLLILVCFAIAFIFVYTEVCPVNCGGSQPCNAPWADMDAMKCP